MVSVPRAFLPSFPRTPLDPSSDCNRRRVNKVNSDVRVEVVVSKYLTECPGFVSTFPVCEKSVPRHEVVEIHTYDINDRTSDVNKVRSGVEYEHRPNTQKM